MQGYLIEDQPSFNFKGQAKLKTLILIDQDDCYIFWDINAPDVNVTTIVDYLKIKENNNKKHLIYQKSLWDFDGTKWSLKDQQRVDIWINQLEQARKVNIKQYLTHNNKIVRDILREILNANLSSG